MTTQRQLDWYQENREAILADRRTYRTQFPERRLLIAARHRAKKHGLPIDITEADIVIPEVCPVLGIPLRFSDDYRNDHSPSLDKIKPELGYVKGNIAVISWKANRLKSNGTATELRRIAEWLENQ